MGREIRRVPSGWEHPRDEKGHFIALYDDTFTRAAQEWLDAAILWSRGEHHDQKAGYGLGSPFFWQWNGGPPDKERYRPEFTTPADCYQIYETVSEGTPVSPVFPTVESMIEWMTRPIDRTSEYNRGADWQSMQGMTRAQAERFCQAGSSPSMISMAGNIQAGHRSTLI